MYTDWIKNLKKGDKVYIDRGRFGTAQLNLTTVKKITPKGHVRTDADTLFRDGNFRIDSWTHWYLVQWTQELEDELKAESHFKYMCHTINAVDMRNESVDKVQKIYDILTNGVGRASK